MIRAALAVVVAVALLAVTAPALDEARVGTTADRLEGEAKGIERGIGGLTREAVAVDDPSLAARTTVTVNVPTGLTAGRLERVAVGTPESMSPMSAGEPIAGHTADIVFIYQFAGDEPRAVPIDSPAGVRLAVEGDPIQLRTGGETSIQLSLVEDDGATVILRRVG